jgi:ribose transport system ATP-binding protein
MLMAARENLTLPQFDDLCTKGWYIRRRVERRQAREWAEAVDLRPPDPEQMLSTLSGGNQQKVVMAKWLRTKPQVLILDEPTSGVDVGAKATLHALIADAAAAGAAVLVCSSDADELAMLADRVLVLREGRIVKDLPREELTEHRLIQESHGRGMEAVIAAVAAHDVMTPQEESSQ